MRREEAVARLRALAARGAIAGARVLGAVRALGGEEGRALGRRVREAIRRRPDALLVAGLGVGVLGMILHGS